MVAKKVEPEAEVTETDYKRMSTQELAEERVYLESQLRSVRQEIAARAGE
jgi:hypothetical protein